MSAIDEFASDVNGVLADLNAQFGVLNDRKQGLKSKGGDIAQRWAQHFDEQARAMQTAEDALNRISNVPLSSTSPAAPVNGALSTIPVKGEK